MDFSCYAKKYRKLEACRRCEFSGYCREAGDLKLTGDVNYEEIAYSESMTDPGRGPDVSIDPEEERSFTLSEVCRLMRRLIELKDGKIRELLSLKLSNPDISFSEMGRRYGVTKQAIHNCVKRAVSEYPELGVVLCNRPMYNRWRGENR